MMRDLRASVPYEEFDYQVLMDALRGYKKPRDKITQLLAKQEIIRIKKGLYVFGKPWQQQTISLEILGNLIYGPSYISREYALAHYGLIPERVHTITSMTTGRKKTFETPLGQFTYEHLSLERYILGVSLMSIDEKRTCLFASKEKALCDTIFLNSPIESPSEMQEHLLENLRIDENDLRQIDQSLMKSIASNYKNPNVALLGEVLDTL